jgi:GxxExxY protein
MRPCKHCNSKEHTARSCPSKSKTTTPSVEDDKVESTEEEVVDDDKKLLKKIEIDEDVHIKFCELVNMSKEVAKELGKRSVESHFQKALGFELQERGIVHSMEESIPVFYKNKYFLSTCRLDIILHSWLPLIIETKAVTTNICHSHIWQLQGYMERKNIPYGVVINFNKSYTKSDVQLRFVVKKDEGYFTYDIETGMGVLMTDY